MSRLLLCQLLDVCVCVYIGVGGEGESVTASNKKKTVVAYRTV